MSASCLRQGQMRLQPNWLHMRDRLQRSRFHCGGEWHKGPRARGVSSNADVELPSFGHASGRFRRSKWASSSGSRRQWVSMLSGAASEGIDLRLCAICTTVRARG